MALPSDTTRPVYAELDALAERARAGERQALAELVERLEGVVRLAVRPYWLVAGGDREDLMQEARLGLLRALRHWRPERRGFLAFAFLCVRRQMAASLREYGRRKHRLLTEALYLSLDAAREPGPGADTRPRHLGVADETGSGDPETLALDGEGRAAVNRLVQEIRTGLTELEWESAWLVLAEGWSYRQAARALGRGTKAVDNAVQRARRKAMQRARAMQADRRWRPVLEVVSVI